MANFDLSTSSDNNTEDKDFNIETTNYNEEPVVNNDIDENDITIADKNTPIVMLFGPRSSGKSMTLVRLSRYLRDCGYTVKVDKTFKSDDLYRERCEKFMKDLDTKDALSGTAYTDFLLVKIIKAGKTICQFLEAPGEHYFDPSDVSVNNFPTYMTKIIKNCKNRKIWAFIAEAEWEVNSNTKRAYVNRIRNCTDQLIERTDRFIIVCNKIDRKDEVFSKGQLRVKAAENYMKEEYEGLADLFRNENPITSLWRKYNYKFVPFCTGHYTKEKGTLRYTESKELYPRMLWNKIMECLKG